MKLIHLIPLIFASVANGPATLSLSPSTSQIQPNQAISIKVTINTNSLDVDGIQFKIKMEGTATIGFQANQISNLNVITSETTSNTITYAAITNQPQSPFSTSYNTQIGVITITPTNSVNLIFDPSYSKITKHGTGEDILLTPTNGQYSLTQTSNPTPTPTPLPNPSNPLTSPTPTPKTSTKTTIKTTPPSATPSPTVTPVPLLSRLFSRTPQPSPTSSYPDSIETTSPEIPPFPWKMVSFLSILLIAATGFTIYIWNKMRQNDLNDLSQSITPPPAR